MRRIALHASLASRRTRPAILRRTLATLVLALGTAPAAAEIVELRLDPPESFADGRSFGPAGAYVRIKGTARGELDPDHPANRSIVDLDKAPRNERGKVEYEMDVFILKPADLTRAPGILLYDVTNRGRKFLLPWINDARSATSAINDPRTAEHAGNGFALERGYTIVWSGWDGDAPKSGGNMTIRVPIATDGGKPIVQRIRHEFQIATRGPSDGLKAALPYPATHTDSRAARFTVRSRESDERTEIPPDRWSFIDRLTIRLEGEGQKFEPLKIYELWYEAQDPRVLGIGFAATRDLISFLRYERTDKAGTMSPVAVPGPASGAGVRLALAVGISQGGRYLRHHLELGTNTDEQGRRVFDGALIHGAGAGKTFANHRFGMPHRTATLREDRFYPQTWFPFASHTSRDPITGREARLHGGAGNEPRVIEVNTSTEYWQKGASLIHTEPDGRRDARLPETHRVFLIAGTQHAGRAGLDGKRGPCEHPRNPHNPAPALRALLLALEQWVVSGRTPPASRVPSIAARTAVAPAALRFPRIAGVTPPADLNPIGGPFDWVDPPRVVEQRYGALVPAVDNDGNETSGIVLPPVAVPLATFAGWNFYRDLPGEMCDRDGLSLPFARSRLERLQRADPRLSVAERYRSREEYAARVKAAADALVRARLLMPRDAEAYVDAAKGASF